MPTPPPTEMSQIETALSYALKQSSYWAERASELSEALLAQSAAVLSDGEDHRSEIGGTGS